MNTTRTLKLKHELFNDHFQNSKRYPIQKAQLIIADIPYNLSNNAFASSPEWYVDGDNKNGESKLANKAFFDTDEDFRIPEFLHFASKMLIPEPKETGKAPCMIVFCAFDQQWQLIEEAKTPAPTNRLASIAPILTTKYSYSGYKNAISNSISNPTTTRYPDLWNLFLFFSMLISTSSLLMSRNKIC